MKNHPVSDLSTLKRITTAPVPAKRRKVPQKPAEANPGEVARRLSLNATPLGLTPATPVHVAGVALETPVAPTLTTPPAAPVYATEAVFAAPAAAATSTATIGFSCGWNCGAPSFSSPDSRFAHEMAVHSTTEMLLTAAKQMSHEQCCAHLSSFGKACVRYGASNLAPDGGPMEKRTELLWAAVNGLAVGRSSDSLPAFVVNGQDRLGFRSNEHATEVLGRNASVVSNVTRSLRVSTPPPQDPSYGPLEPTAWIGS